MKAAYITGHGGNEVVSVGERPLPVRRAGEVLVRLRAATVNRVDLYMRDSGAGITHRLPQVMGLDGAGVVEEVDAGEALPHRASSWCSIPVSAAVAANSACGATTCCALR